jgi:hypothetical protein
MVAGLPSALDASVVPVLPRARGVDDRVQREVAVAMVAVVGVGVLRFASYSSLEPKEGGGDFGRFLLDELLRKRSKRGG